MSDYYAPCKEFDECNALIEQYWVTEQYEKCFAGHLKLAKQGYPLAECQIGYFYLEGYGVQKNLTQAFYWTERAAQHGDRRCTPKAQNASRTVPKSQKLEKRAFSLPYISHNVHYTKYM